MKYRSDILRTIHESAVDKFEIGAISKARMREFDEMCLDPEENLAARQTIQEDEITYEADKPVESSAHAMEHITA